MARASHITEKWRAKNFLLGIAALFCSSFVSISPGEHFGHLFILIHEPKQRHLHQNLLVLKIVLKNINSQFVFKVVLKRENSQIVFKEVYLISICFQFQKLEFNAWVSICYRF